MDLVCGVRLPDFLRDFGVHQTGANFSEGSERARIGSVVVPGLSVTIVRLSPIRKIKYFIVLIMRVRVALTVHSEFRIHTLITIDTSLACHRNVSNVPCVRALVSEFS